MLQNYVQQHAASLSGPGSPAAWEAFGRFAQQHNASFDQALAALREVGCTSVGPQERASFEQGHGAWNRDGIGRPSGYDASRMNPRPYNGLGGAFGM